MAAEYALFDTAVGRCGIARGADGAVTAVRLPVVDLVSGANLDDDLTVPAHDVPRTLDDETG